MSRNVVHLAEVIYTRQSFAGRKLMIASILTLQHIFHLLFRILTMVLSQLSNIVFMYVFIAVDTYRNNFNRIIILTNL